MPPPPYTHKHTILKFTHRQGVVRQRCNTTTLRGKAPPPVSLYPLLKSRTVPHFQLQCSPKSKAFKFQITHLHFWCTHIQKYKKKNNIIPPYFLLFFCTHPPDSPEQRLLAGAHRWGSLGTNWGMFDPSWLPQRHEDKPTGSCAEFHILAPGNGFLLTPGCEPWPIMPHQAHLLSPHSV